MHSLALRSRQQFLDLCRNGLRPPFIPSNPDQIYRDVGWTSYPDWLGHPRRAPKAVVPRDEKKTADSANSERAKVEFVDFVAQARPDIEIKKIPRGFSASHRFRILESIPESGEATKSDQWVLIQIRWTTANASRSGCFQVKHTAEPDTGVIVLSECGVVAGRRRELLSDYRRSHFHEVATVLSTFDEWWSSCQRLSEAEFMKELRAAPSFSNRSLFGSGTVSELRRMYFDPLGLSVRPPGDLFESRVNVILGGRFRILIRNASTEARTKAYYYVTLTTRGRVPTETDGIDFVLATGFEIKEGLYPASSRPFFLFPRSFLAQKGYFTTKERAGKHSLYLYPPWKKETRKIAAVRKAEQAPFFVDSVERLAEILKEYGGTEAGDPTGGFEKLQVADFESAKLLV